MANSYSLNADSYFCFRSEQTRLNITVENKNPTWSAHKNRAYSSLKLLDEHASGGNVITIPGGIKIDMIAKTIFDRYEKKLGLCGRIADRLKGIFVVTKRQKMKRIIKKMETLSTRVTSTPGSSSRPDFNSIPQAKRKGDNKPYEHSDFFIYYASLDNLQLDLEYRLSRMNASKIVPECSRIINDFCKLYNYVDYTDIPNDNPNDILYGLNAATNENIKKLKDKAELVSQIVSKILSKVYPKTGANRPPFETFREQYPEAIRLLEDKWRNCPQT